jgi:hypothetical protein
MKEQARRDQTRKLVLGELAACEIRAALSARSNISKPV